MRKFIISDIHGNGNLYYSIMNYLDNISKNDEVTLYINGDLIDRGNDSGMILLDVIKRINDKSNSFKIIYLGGNHELMMYELLQKKIKGRNTFFNDWYFNGGKVTEKYLNSILRTKEEWLEIIDFIANLKIYHKFDEKINDKNIVLVHAACPLFVKDSCNLFIKDNNPVTLYSVWTRENDFPPFKFPIGNRKYFTIIGHTPVNKSFGYEYNKRGNYLNIDGGSAIYAYDKTIERCYPLVEIENNYLKILSFNNHNDIAYANYFIDKRNIQYSEPELHEAKVFLKRHI